jgi:Tn3 transposase DDE domain
VVKSGDPVEQEKQLKYASLVANAVMLSNVFDLTEVLSAMAKDGHPVTPALVASISPYIRDHIRRFGRFALDMAELPTLLNPQPLRSKTLCDYFLHVSDPTPCTGSGAATLRRSKQDYLPGGAVLRSVPSGRPHQPSPHRPFRCHFP